MAENRPFETLLEIPVRGYDIDFAGIVSNIVYIRWLEDLRMKMLSIYLPLDKQLAEGYFPVLASTHIDYKRPITLFDSVIGKMWVSQITHTRCILGAEFFVNGEIGAVAQQTTVFVDFKTRRPIRIPKTLATLMTGT